MSHKVIILVTLIYTVKCTTDFKCNEIYLHVHPVYTDIVHRFHITASQMPTAAFLALMDIYYTEHGLPPQHHSGSSSSSTFPGPEQLSKQPV